MTRLHRKWSLVLAVAFGCCMNGPSHADPAVALVESVSSSSANVLAMEFLSSGYTMSIGPDEEVVLSYLRSCIREEISGGRVTVGQEQSDVVGGLVVRERVNCDTDQFVLTAGQADESAALTFRAGDGGDPVVTVYGTKPIFVLERVPNALVLERRDLRHAPVTLRPDGQIYDLSGTDITLSPGAVYRVSVGDREISVRVDQSARRDRVPAVSRIVLF